MSEAAEGRKSNLFSMSTVDRIKRKGLMQKKSSLGTSKPFLSVQSEALKEIARGCGGVSLTEGLPELPRQATARSNPGRGNHVSSSLSASDSLALM